MLRFTYILAFLLAFRLAHSVELSDSSRISLLTVNPGEELYSAFGHTGIRVIDYKNEFDVVFNYGTFDYDQEGFYINFVKGDMMYMITADPYRFFNRMYEHERRGVREQELNLSTTEKQNIFAFLYHNSQPENREYRYDFFWDNCCTRPRDIFEKELGNRLKYDYSKFDTTHTMRETLKPYVKNMPWVDLGFDLILGLPCEVKATPRNQTFLPDRLELLLDNATVDGKPFVTNKTTLLDIPFKPEPFTGITPMLVTFGLLVVGLALGLVERLRNTHFWWFDFPIFFIFGLQGLIFMLLGMFSSHYSLPWNLNCLWLIPTHCIVAFFFFKKQKPRWMQHYFIATAVLMLILVIGWGWNPQPFNMAVLPLILLLAGRSFKIFIRLKQLSPQ